ncbi:MAG: hypothetical protein GXX95_03195 [Methanomassiliicoccus sp.]|nr:hypothetical protein [Methanomassiliicoccus sp.]
MLMRSDVLESVGQKVNLGNIVYILTPPPDSEAEAHQLFNELSPGGKGALVLFKRERSVHKRRHVGAGVSDVPAMVGRGLQK